MRTVDYLVLVQTFLLLSTTFWTGLPYTFLVLVAPSVGFCVLHDLGHFAL